MAEIVKMPKLSDTMTEGVVAEWHKKVGDFVESGELLAEIETDKATMEFESFNAGTLLFIGINEGQSAPVDSVLAIIGPAGTDITGVAENFKKGGTTYWVKKVIYFPIAERWLLISVGAVAFGPELTLIALIVLGFLSLSYVKLGRVLRSYKWGDKINNCDFIDQQGDIGFNLKFSNFRFGWGLSSVLRLIEFVLIVAIFNFEFNLEFKKLVVFIDQG